MTDKDFYERGWKLEIEYTLDTKVYKKDYSDEYTKFSEAMYNPINKQLKITYFWDSWQSDRKKRELFLGKCPDKETFDYICNLIF